MHFARKIHHIANETKPIIFVDIRAVAIYEFRLAAFASARNCLSSHWVLPFFQLFSCARWLTVGGLEAAGAAAADLESGRKEEIT